MSLKLKGKPINIPCDECGEILKDGLCKWCESHPVNKAYLLEAEKKISAGQKNGFSDEETLAMFRSAQRKYHKINIYAELEKKIRRI